MIPNRCFIVIHQLRVLLKNQLSDNYNIQEESAKTVSQKKLHATIIIITSPLQSTAGYIPPEMCATSHHDVSRRVVRVEAKCLYFHSYFIDIKLFQSGSS